jgi:hypothetical protein
MFLFVIAGMRKLQSERAIGATKGEAVAKVIAAYCKSRGTASSRHGTICNKLKYALALPKYQDKIS